MFLDHLATTTDMGNKNTTPSSPFHHPNWAKLIVEIVVIDT
jgi:hypothetical protein